MEECEGRWGARPWGEPGKSWCCPDSLMQCCRAPFRRPEWAGSTWIGRGRVCVCVRVPLSIRPSLVLSVTLASRLWAPGFCASAPVAAPPAACAPLTSPLQFPLWLTASSGREGGSQTATQLSARQWPTLTHSCHPSAFGLCPVHCPLCCVEHPNRSGRAARGLDEIRNGHLIPPPRGPAGRLGCSAYPLPLSLPPPSDALSTHLRWLVCRPVLSAGL